MSSTSIFEDCSIDQDKCDKRSLGDADSRNGSLPVADEESTKSRTGRESPLHSSHIIRSCLLKKVQEKKAKKVKFFRNGDKFYNGFSYALSLEKIRTFDALLADLTRVLVDQVNLPTGVRFIFSVDGKDKISSLEQFMEGGNYVCSSNENFIKLDYSKNEKPFWDVTKANIMDESFKLTSGGEQYCEKREFIKPKLITVIRSGVKPRKIIRMLLNKKTAHSFEQVLNDVTKQLDTGAVRKVLTLSGKQVLVLSDFFSSEEIFIAYGTEKTSPEDFWIELDEYKQVTHGLKNIQNILKYVKRPNELSEGVSPGNSHRSSFCSASPLVCSPHIKRQSNQDSHIIEIPSIPKAIEKKYDVTKIIGDGNFAVVLECVDKATNIAYALKVIDKHKIKEHMIHYEVSILRLVKHVNIVQLIEDFDYKDHIFLVMELVKGGDLFDAITSVKKFPENDSRSMVRDLCSALSYLHSRYIVHRDIKPENLLVVEHENGTLSLKLGDFGLAVEAKTPLYVVCGTPTYVAPEILAETGYGVKVDVWAAGVLTYILLCGYPPFDSNCDDQELLFDQILSGQYEFTSPFWDVISDSAKDLISKMLQVDPDKRYSAAEVLNHPWLSCDENEEEGKALSKDILEFNKPKSSLTSTIGLIADARNYFATFEIECKSVILPQYRDKMIFPKAQDGNFLQKLETLLFLERIRQLRKMDLQSMIPKAIDMQRDDVPLDSKRILHPELPSQHRILNLHIAQQKKYDILLHGCHFLSRQYQNLAFYLFYKQDDQISCLIA